MKKQIETIAKQRLNIKSLKAQNNDSADFHELHVNSINNALRAAFAAGRGILTVLDDPEADMFLTSVDADQFIDLLHTMFESAILDNWLLEGSDKAYSKFAKAWKKFTKFYDYYYSEENC